jgi:hypothetical protein
MSICDIESAVSPHPGDFEMYVYKALTHLQEAWLASDADNKFYIEIVSTILVIICKQGSNVDKLLRESFQEKILSRADKLYETFGLKRG